MQERRISIALAALMFVLGFLGSSNQAHARPDAVVNGFNGKLRAEPSSESALIKPLMFGTRMRAVKRSEDREWIQVKSGRKLGWVKANDVRLVKPMKKKLSKAAIAKRRAQQRRARAMAVSLNTAGDPSGSPARKTVRRRSD